MSKENHDRRDVLRLSGSALAALGGVSLVGNAGASPETDCLGCDDGGDGGGGGGGTGSVPSVSTRSATTYSDYAEMTGSLDALGDDSSADVWFEWGPEGDGLPYDTRLLTRYEPTFFQDTTTDGLSYGTYEYRAVASNDWGKAEGYIQTFTI